MISRIAQTEDSLFGSLKISLCTLDHKDSSSASSSQAFLCLVLVISRAAIEIKPTLAQEGDLLEKWS